MNPYIKQANQQFVPVYNRYPIVWDHGEGMYLYDTEGKRYLDFGSGIGVCALGYHDPNYTRTLQEQMEKLLHTSNLFYNVPAIEAAKLFNQASGIVRRIFDEYLGGKGSYAIAKELQAEGVPTIRTAKAWQDNVVKWILQNPVYEGDLLYQKTYTTEGVPFTKKYNHGELPKYLVSDNHEPIISREEAEAVRQIYEYRRQKHHMDNVEIYQSRYAFSSRIICGECGSTFRRQKIYIGKPYEKIQWSCRQHIADITKCRQKPIREDVIRQMFLRMWNKLAGHAEDVLLPLLAVLKAVPNDAAQEQELLTLENRIQELKQQSHWLQKVLSDGDIGSAVFIERRNQLDTELEEISRRQQFLKEQNLMEQEIAQTEYLLTVFRTRPVMIEEFDEELFRLIVERIRVYPNRLCFELKNGLELEEHYRKEV